VDWRKADTILYPVVRLRVTALAKWIAYFLSLLEAEYRISADNVHLVGHSLGAHIAGVVGVLQGSQLGRITGKITN